MPPTSIHSLATEGVFTPEGEFLPFPLPATSLLADIEERFRHLVLKGFTAPRVFPEAFLHKLLGWNPSGFSVHANQLVFADEPDRLERLARYLTRAPLGVDRVRTSEDERVEVITPPQAGTAQTFLRLDPLDWIHALCQQIPDRGQHLTRYYRAYANRTPKAVFRHDTPQILPSEPQPEPDSASSRALASRACWARLLRKVFGPGEVHNCGAEMRLVAFFTEPRSIRRFLQNTGLGPPRKSPPLPSPNDVISRWMTRIASSRCKPHEPRELR